MRKIVFVILAALFVSACNKSENELKPVPVKQDNTQKGTSLLLKYIETYGDFINSNDAPALVIADELNNEKDNFRWLIIDIRTNEDYKKGHIINSRNVKFDQLPVFLKDSVKAEVFEKIVLVDNDGQESGYAASLLRILGYANVYNLKFGMASWNKSLSGIWEEALSSDYAGLFDTTVVEMPVKGNLPDYTGKEIQPDKMLEEKVIGLFAEGFEKAKITAREFAENPENFFILNYESMPNYLATHISGAVLFKNRQSLSLDKDLLSIPVNKPVLVYCLSGHKSAYVTAFLKVLGYDAKSLVYGINSMIVNTVKAKSWNSFVKEEDSNEFELIIGQDPAPKKDTTQAIVPNA